MGADAAPDAATVNLWQRVLVLRAFPGSYTLAGLRDVPALELLHALELLDAAAKLHSG